METSIVYFFHGKCTMTEKEILVCGAGGFIGHHLVNRLTAEGHRVTGADLKHPQFEPTKAHNFKIGDLRQQDFVRTLISQPFDEIYQLAADMGGAGYLFTGDNDADIVANSAQINLNILDACRKVGIGRIFYSSSACVYPEHNQLDPDNPDCREDTVYPAAPDSEYGWEKLFSERLYLSYARNHGMQVRIARYHNIFGPLGTWTGGKEKVPAAICRKVAMAENADSIEVWGDGRQTRSFLFIDDCLDATIELMRSDFSGPVNIGSEELVSINRLVEIVSSIAGKEIAIRHIDGPVGVRGRRSNNELMEQAIGWRPSVSLQQGLDKTYLWIASQIRHDNGVPSPEAMGSAGGVTTDMGV